MSIGVKFGAILSEYELKIPLSSKPVEYGQRTYISFSCESSAIVLILIELTVSGIMVHINHGQIRVFPDFTRKKVSFPENRNTHSGTMILCGVYGYL